jgi:predicted amidophosphoribosyltransferase
VKSLLNLLFPPRCRLCSERTDYLFCTVCCELMALPDPTLRCGHCFVALESDVRLCMRCTHQPILSAPRAFLFEESPLIAQLLSLLQRQDEAFRFLPQARRQVCRAWLSNLVEFFPVL